ncbi:uncharacterized protein EAF01_008850 [Botrytis porri]|uniref:uncharacterized protein n=1 Tax=Botrytis porri TaxID=87229 RepID=UPI0019026954|nr:uncharacterized protein EAF01_008850 [Botrytis porri]KAF7897884.1 hypothetical protein EAF01_008850 [Botrytis porri]
MSNDLSSSDLVNSPTVPQRSAAIVNLDGRWALYHETKYAPDIPETSYYLLELGTGITTKLPKWPRPTSAGRVDTLLSILKALYFVESDRTRRIYVAIAVSGIGTRTTSASSSVSEVDVLGCSSRLGGQVLRCLVFKTQREFPYINIEFISGDILETINLKYVPFPTRVSMGPRNFDISRAGLALAAQTEEQSQARHDGISDVHFIPFDQLPTPKKSKELIPIKIETTRVIENREEVINESNGPEDGITENREGSGNASENRAVEPPFPVLANRGGQVGSPLYRHSAYMWTIWWQEERRRCGFEDVDLDFDY